MKSNIEILSELRAQFNCFDEAEEPCYRALSDAICALSAQTHWIPCSERLPLTYDGDIPVVETYIVTVSVDGVLFVDEAYNFGTYIDGFWDTVVDWDEGNDVHVLAWMPRPKPYGGDAKCQTE